MVCDWSKKMIIKKKILLMEKIIENAKKLFAFPLPNPRISAILTKSNTKNIIVEKNYEFYGDKHAERKIIDEIKEKFSYIIDDKIECDLYINLEPCSHFGNNPPCCVGITDSLINIKNVFIPFLDIDEKVRGNGINHLKANGIKVINGGFVDECYDVNEDFIYNRYTNKPLITIKWAASLDGKIANDKNESKWITLDKTRMFANHLRNNFQAIMVGGNTLNFDNPKLNIRDNPNPYNITKIIVSSLGKINYKNAIFLDQSNKIILATTENIDKEELKKAKNFGLDIILTKPTLDGKVDLIELIELLGKKGIASIMVEGGGELFLSLIKYNLVNKIIAFVGAKILSGNKNSLINNSIFDNIENSLNLKLTKVVPIENDVAIFYDTMEYYNTKKIIKKIIEYKGK
jgi:diaminohydroxyphosphoribosylaminopyrimidine deaminase/5-amino-6-(5-phosphoribosylamino)uracil reductase